jgi:hypothetical protein
MYFRFPAYQTAPHPAKSKGGNMAIARMPQPTADDPVKVDPKHYKVEFENDRVRVLRINTERARNRSCTPTLSLSPCS